MLAQGGETQRLHKSQAEGCKAHSDIGQSQLENLMSGPSIQRVQGFDRGELL